MPKRLCRSSLPVDLTNRPSLSDVQLSDNLLQTYCEALPGLFHVALQIPPYTFRQIRHPNSVAEVAEVYGPKTLHLEGDPKGSQKEGPLKRSTGIALLCSSHLTSMTRWGR